MLEDFIKASETLGALGGALGFTWKGIKLYRQAFLDEQKEFKEYLKKMTNFFYFRGPFFIRFLK